MKNIKSLIITAFVASLFASCDYNTKSSELSENPDYIKKDKALCSANDINGLLVFIKGTPIKDYEFLGTVKNDFIDQVNDASQKKGFGKLVKGLLETTTNNIDFQKLLDSMTSKAKQDYPKAEAVIFKDNLSNCEVIKFK